MRRTYLDHNATTPLHPDARDAMARAFDLFGNPSSIHAEGRSARAVIDEAREQVAALVGTAADEIVFTSCGTEALNVALSPDLADDSGGCEVLFVGGGEHPAVLRGHRFGDACETIALTADGGLDLAVLDGAIARHAGRRVMLALQAVNNETGVVQPVAAAAAMVHAHGGLVVVDAVQAVGKVACRIADFDADAMAISAHKFGGPKGVGALCFAPGRHHVKHGVVRGGGHERGLSAGTENVVGIAGMGAVCKGAERRRIEDAGIVVGRQEWLERVVLSEAPGARVWGREAARAPNTTCVAVPGYDAQILLMNLDLNGVAVSGGSACSSGKVKPSHVLTAMGVDAALATSTIRISTGWTTTDADIEAFSAAFAKALKTMRPRAAA